jgi:HYR domain-containing protein
MRTANAFAVAVSCFLASNVFAGEGDLNCPDAVTAECDSTDGAVVIFDDPTFPPCSPFLPPPAVTCDPPSGSVFPLGTTTVHCTGMDACGTHECSFDVTVEDTTPPIIECPDPIRVVCSGDPVGTIVEFQPTVTDQCDIQTVYECVPPSLSRFPLGSTTVSCTARDTSGNSSECSFTVTVLGSTSSDLPTAVVGQPASALVFPLFDSTAHRGTVITVTNTDTDRLLCGNGFHAGDVRLLYTYFGFDESRQFCREFDTSHFLTPGDTLTVLADQDNPEGEVGWLWVEARDPETGEAIAFDHLLGSAIVVDTDLDFLDQYLPYGFRSYVARAGLLGVPGCSAPPTDVNGNGRADFDGIEYDFWPQRLLLDQFFQEGGGTGGFANELTLASCDVDPFDDHGTNVSIHPWNNRERSFSVALNFECFFHAPLSSISGIFARLGGDPNELVVSGHHLQSGWVEFDADDPILGVFFQRVVGSGFAAGHQMQIAGQFGGPCDDNPDHVICSLPRID